MCLNQLHDEFAGPAGAAGENAEKELVDSTTTVGSSPRSLAETKVPESVTFWAPCETIWIALEGRSIHIGGIPLVLHRDLHAGGYNVSDPVSGGRVLNEARATAASAVKMARLVLQVQGADGFRTAQERVRQQARENLGPKPEVEPVAGLVLEAVHG